MTQTPAGLQRKQTHSVVNSQSRLLTSPSQKYMNQMNLHQQFLFDQHSLARKQNDYQVQKMEYQAAEQEFLVKVLTPGFNQANNHLTLMQQIYKRNKNKNFFTRNFSKSLRFFVLDFQSHKFYYKQSQSSSDIKFICSFNQMLGIKVIYPE